MYTENTRIYYTTLCNSKYMLKRQKNMFNINLCYKIFYSIIKDCGLTNICPRILSIYRSTLRSNGHGQVCTGMLIVLLIELPIEN